MVETCVGPSELHLKKELTALRKSRYLRDPETSSSWRSPLSSRLVAAEAYTSKYRSEIKKDDTSINSSGPVVDVGCNSSSTINENRRKKVYLYNWGNHSRRSSDSGLKLDDDIKQGSVQACPQDSICKAKKLDVKDDVNTDDCAVFLPVREADPDLEVSRTSRKLRRKSVSKQHASRSSAISNLLDVPSSSLAILNSLGQYNDSECSNSDLPHSERESNQKCDCGSRAMSPLVSVSGCGNWSDSCKILRHNRKDESSCSFTPVSTSSYNRHGDQNASTIGSWNETAGFDGDERDQMDLPGRQGCGIPCYSSKRRKDRGCGGWYSPSLSDTLRRKGSSILCGSQSVNHRRTSGGTKRRNFPKSSQGLPLLRNSYDQAGSSADTETDELSTNYGEIDLEAISRLDGSRWSNCRSRGADMALPNADNGVSSNPRCLSQKYRPQSFEEIIGQNIVVQSLNNAILRGRIAPAYIFQGPRGTGKTCMARIFAAALNCLSSEKAKPCGSCRECTHFASGNASNTREVDAVNKKAIDRVKYILRNLSAGSSFSRYKVFVIDDCHMLSTKTWSTLMKFLEDPPSRVVFIFVTIDPDNVPRAVVSRCQRFIFPKVKDADIVNRLRDLSSKENLDTELEALDLIALNSNGSLRDAETMLEQLSLLGKRITSSLVHDIVGVVSDDKLLDLLEISMSGDTAETVRKSRELLNSGIDPTRLMSQLAGLIMDIIAGTHQLASSKSDSVLGGRRLTEAELDRLQQALKVLSEAEKQLRHSSERSTWFTAALLQLGAGQTFDSIHSSGSSSKHSIMSLRVARTVGLEASGYQKLDLMQKLQHASPTLVPGLASAHTSPLANASSSISMRHNPTFDTLSNSFTSGKVDDKSVEMPKSTGRDELDVIWRRCIQGCHSRTLRNLLSTYGKLVSVIAVEGGLVAFVTFKDEAIKSRAERFLSSITNSMEIALRQTVEIKFELMSDSHLNETPGQKLQESTGSLNADPTSEPSKLISLVDPQKQPRDALRESVNHSENLLQCSQELDEIRQETALPGSSLEQDEVRHSTDKVHGATIVDCGTASEEQRLESAWLQTAEKGTPASVNNLKPEKNQILPQNGFGRDASWELAFSSKHWEDELNHEIKALKIGGPARINEEIAGAADHYPFSPSHLRGNKHHGVVDKRTMGPGCNGLLCWRVNRSPRSGTLLKPKKSARIPCFGRGRSKMSAEKKLQKNST